jgi:hypothetical protein
VIKTDLSDVYRDYIACLNKQDWPKLEQFVHDEVIHNGRRVGLSGYLGMLERDFDEIPDLFDPRRLIIVAGRRTGKDRSTTFFVLLDNLCVNDRSFSAVTSSCSLGALLFLGQLVLSSAD